MKILIINYRFFISGGPERYMFNLIELLEKKGHEIIPFSINYRKNRETKFKKYFVSPISSEEEIYFREDKKNIKSLLKALSRTFYSIETYKKLNQLIREVKPDFAIVLHYQRKLSPSVIDCLYKNRIPFVVRLSDFAMICPNAHFIRNNNICEECLSKGLFSSVKYSCVQNSKLAALINYLSLLFQKQIKIFDKISFFIVPSKFTIEKHIAGGFKSEKFIHVPTFINVTNPYIIKKKNNIVLYIGRLERIKGVHILLEAATFLKNEKININIIGDGDKQYIEELKSYCIKNQLINVTFFGFLDRKEEIFKLYKEALVTIIPSLWYENQPNSALESMANGVPVIASNIGSLREIIIDGVNGYLFKMGDSLDLSIKIKNILHNPNYEALQKGAIEYIEKYHSPELHYNKLIEIYNRIKEGIN